MMHQNNYCAHVLIRCSCAHISLNVIADLTLLIVVNNMVNESISRINKVNVLSG